MKRDPGEETASEVPQSMTSPPSQSHEHSRPLSRVTFPNRVTLDLDDDRYHWLTETADNSGAVGGANLLRAALDYLSSHPAALGDVVLRAQELRRGQRAATRRRGHA